MRLTEAEIAEIKRKIRDVLYRHNAECRAKDCVADLVSDLAALFPADQMRKEKPCD